MHLFVGVVAYGSPLSDGRRLSNYLFDPVRHIVAQTMTLILYCSFECVSTLHCLLIIQTEFFGNIFDH
jgi:hypothetical protein